jgi:hypothetical protein
VASPKWITEKQRPESAHMLDTHWSNGDKWEVVFLVKLLIHLEEITFKPATRPQGGPQCHQWSARGTQKAYEDQAVRGSFRTLNDLVVSAPQPDNMPYRVWPFGSGLVAVGGPCLSTPGPVPCLFATRLAAPRAHTGKSPTSVRACATRLVKALVRFFVFVLRNLFFELH